ncbi:hypothetical protein JZ751_003767 [Albula glossodonta]|uniref:Uncharacterized protein n=1 Tax=Albula glossodonta TaxID=121402 RepID=A0A8T2P2V6_9TELE|nr:hypothetical protein JZ751_003767 [Albula glossodonta]
MFTAALPGQRILEQTDGSEDTRVHLPIALVICGMVFLLLVAVLTLQIKRHGKESDQYATISLQKNRKEKKADHAEDSITYSLVHYHRKPEHHSPENFMQ